MPWKPPEGPKYDSESVIQKRMAEAQVQLSRCNEFDYLVVNDDLTSAHDRFRQCWSANCAVAPDIRICWPNLSLKDGSTAEKFKFRNRTDDPEHCRVYTMFEPHPMFGIDGPSCCV